MTPDAAKTLKDQLRQACADLKRRADAGEDCRAEELLRAHPALATNADAALELIYTEFVLREQWGQQTADEEWYSRFPQWREDMRELFEVHRAASAAPSLSALDKSTFKVADERRVPSATSGIAVGSRLGN